MEGFGTLMIKKAEMMENNVVQRLLHVATSKNIRDNMYTNNATQR